MISVVIESWNLDDAAADGLGVVLAALAPQVGDGTTTDVVVTHRGLPELARAALATTLGHPITWVELPADAGYYEHKNHGFDAATGDVVAFIDGDCAPSSTWLAAITLPIVDGTARVVAGATSYPGPLAPLANQLDFPYFETTTSTVRNFFANNVAFARDVFAARRYPTIEPMFHGQCQVLGLRLLEAGIAIRFAPDARVIHAWPESLREWLAVRLLRGADTVSLLPYVVGTYAPRASPIVARLGAVPALVVLGLRAITGAWSAVRRGPRVRNLGLVAGVTLVDAVGAAAAPAVYRWIA